VQLIVEEICPSGHVKQNLVNAIHCIINNCKTFKELSTVCKSRNNSIRRTDKYTIQLHTQL